MKGRTIAMSILSAVLLTLSYVTASSSPAHKNSEHDNLIGCWRATVKFKTGPWSQVKDLEFMYAFNSGGTMTESSNYDGSPPAPPAYGVWRVMQRKQYEAKYVYFESKAPKAFEEIANGGGWLPGGSGVLVEAITLSEDGKTFKSTIRLNVIDEAGKPIESNSEAEVQAVRISF